MISVDTVFKIINFLAFSSVAVYLFKKHIAPYFVSEKKRFEDEIKDKKASRKKLQIQLDDLIENHAHQLSQGRSLQKKCKQWAQHLKDVHDKEEEEKKQVREQMIKRRQMQWQFVQKQRCLQQKLPIIFRDVEYYFEEVDNKEAVSKNYCDKLITFMKD